MLIVKDIDKIASTTNFRPIAISSVIIKAFELLILNRIK